MRWQNPSPQRVHQSIVSLSDNALVLNRQQNVLGYTEKEANGLLATKQRPEPCYPSRYFDYADYRQRGTPYH
jgi:hypothetical protein